MVNTQPTTSPASLGSGTTSPTAYQQQLYKKPMASMSPAALGNIPATQDMPVTIRVKKHKTSKPFINTPVVAANGSSNS